MHCTSKHCLLSSKSALRAPDCFPWNVQLLDFDLQCSADIIARRLGSGEEHEASAQQAVESFLERIDDLKDAIKDASSDATKEMDKYLLERLQAVKRRVKDMAARPSTNKTVQQIRRKTLADLQNKWQQIACYNKPLIAARCNTATNGTGTYAAHSSSSSSSIIKGPFRDDITGLIANSEARSNQKEAYDAVCNHFAGWYRNRPAQQLLDAAMQATLEAFCALRVAVLSILMDSDATASSAWRQQLDCCLREFKDALNQELKLCGPWGKAAGLVEPTGSGKTGIIHLIPHAALGCQAPEDVPRKVLIVAPTIVIREHLTSSCSPQQDKNCLTAVLGVQMPPGMLPEMYDLSDLPSSVVAAAAAVALPEDDELSNSVIHFEEHAEHAEYFNNSVESAEPDAVQSWRRTTLTSSSPGKSPAAAVRLSTTAGAATAVAAAQHTALQKMAAADVVVANIQRLRVLKLQGLFPRGYFGVVIIDEGHHAAARTCLDVLTYFASAAQVLLTATPFRGDRRRLPMITVIGDGAELKIADRIRQGYSSNVAFAPVPVNSVTIQEEGSSPVTCHGLEAIQGLGERRSIQKAARQDLELVRLPIMRHSLQLMQHLRGLTGQRHTVIAQAYDIKDAESLQQEWQALIDREFGGRYSVACTHSQLPKKSQDLVKAAAKAGTVDVIIHVGQLGEGFDAPLISVVAVFKVFRSMGPFLQLLGRAVRRIHEIPAHNEANVAYLVAHPLLGYHQHWSIYCQERQDQPNELRGKGRDSSGAQILSCCSPSGFAAPGPEQYVVNPAEMAGDRLASSPAAAANQPAASTSSAQQSYLAKIRRIAVALQAEVKMKQLRDFKEQLHPYLSHITTSGRGRTVANVKQDMAIAIREILLQQVVQG